jgi:DNA-binding SARP family transcriptional activator/TolB-like protein
MGSARLRLLGELTLEDGAGRAVALPTRKAQAALAILARRPGRATARAHLAGLLWPDRADAQGRGSLRQALASIRRALEQCGAAVPAPGGDAIALPTDAVDVDVARFEAALADGDATAAVALYRGPFLAGFPPVEDAFDDWVIAERAILASRAADAFRARLDVLVGAGDGDAALALADRALSLDPAFEPAWRARMRVHLARGDRAGAAREWERCRAALQRAVGVEPSAETASLRRLATDPGAEAPRPGRCARALAIAPFEILSEDASLELFARGLEDDVRVELSRFRTLDVIARDSTRTAAADSLAPVRGLRPGSGAGPRDGLDAPQAGRALGADYVLSATVRAAAGRLRVSPVLVEVASARQIWADRLEADLADLFVMQDRITQAVVSALALRIDDAELAAARQRPTERLDAYACWVRGMTTLRTGTVKADAEARALFRRALELDPAFARAYAGLSLAHFNDWSCAAWERWDENEREAFRYAEEAARLDPRDHVAQVVLGRILLYRREFERSAAHLARALALNPNDPDVLVHLANGYAHLGDPERGLALAEAARRLHPFHPDWYFGALAGNHFIAGHWREAATLLARTPDAYADSRAFLAAAHAHLGDLDRARDHARRFLARFGVAIAPGARPADAVAWVLRVNPLRREADRDVLVAGLVRAGLPAPAPSPSAAPVPATGAFP